MEKNIQKYKVLLLFTLVAVLGLFALYLNFKQNLPKTYLKNGGFKRIEKHITTTLKQSVNLKHDSYEFVGYFKNEILIRAVNQNILLSFSKDKPLYNNIFFDLNKALPYPNDITSIEVDSSKSELHVMSVNRNELVVFDLLSKQKKLTIKLPSGVARGTLINHRLILLKDKEGGTKAELSFYRVNDQGKMQLVQKSSDIFGNEYRMQDDGLVRAGFGGKIVFVNFFINKFHLLDSTLKILTKGKTIDTVTTAPKISISNGGSIKSYGEPIRIVNDNFRMFGNLLLIRSLIASNNIEIGAIREKAVIDVYDLKSNGQYKYSFFLSGVDGVKPTDFYFTENCLFLVYPDKLLIYEYKAN